MDHSSTPLSFPSGRQYQESLQNTSLCFNHHELNGTMPEMTKLGLPRPISGQFASVFSVTSATGKRYAVKCFTSHVSDQQDRYEAISAKLSGITSSSLSQPWRMGFEYLAEGILVNGARYPILKMDWVDATTLSAWLDMHHSDQNAVARLAERFAELANDLASHDIAHGDLQHGNLLVASDGTFRLVDYDGMYVPALAGRHSTERGHRNYQSPARSGSDFSTSLDHFSAWVIYLALTAISIDPSLWSRLHEPAGEFLLLTEDDFKSPGTSLRFPELLGHGDSTVRGLAEQVRSLAWQPLAVVPPLSVTTPAAPPQASVHVPGPRAGSARPDWLNSHLTAPSPLPAASAPSANVPQGYLGRRFIDVLGALVLALALLMPGFLWLMELLPLGALSLVGALAVAVTPALLARRSRPENRAMRSRLGDVTARRSLALGPVKEAERLEADRKAHEDSEKSRSEKLTASQSELRSGYQKDVQKAERERARAHTSINNQISSLSGKQQKELARTLENRRNAFIQEELRKARIDERQLTGIGRTTVQDLARHGIRTAADFTGYTLVSTGSQRNAFTARIITSSGHSVDVKGVGQVRAATLDAWRQRQYDRAASRSPSSLPAAVRSDIESKWARQKRDLESRRGQADNTVQVATAQAKSTLEAGLARLADDDARASRQSAQERQEFARRATALGDPRARLAAVDQELAAARKEARALSFSRYVRFCLTGR